ncbi:MAG: hypothetical protein PHC62_00265 [Candidatus Izemoplasmatales bacterium]|nr:hypothetical protein [Candidatus Izemoplasmatales bacterium]
MAIFIIDKLKPKNNGAFRLMDTLDIDHRGYELKDWLDALEFKLEDLMNHIPSDTTFIEIENQDGVIVWKYKNETEWRVLIDLNQFGKEEVYIGKNEPQDQDVKVWFHTPDDEIEEEEFMIPEKVSELENDSNYITLNDLKDKLRIRQTNSKTYSLLYDDITLSEFTVN